MGLHGRLRRMPNREQVPHVPRGILPLPRKKMPTLVRRSILPGSVSETLQAMLPEMPHLPRSAAEPMRLVLPEAPALRRWAVRVGEEMRRCGKHPPRAMPLHRQQQAVQKPTLEVPVLRRLRPLGGDDATAAKKNPVGPPTCQPEVPTERKMTASSFLSFFRHYYFVSLLQLKCGFRNTR